MGLWAIPKILGKLSTVVNSRTSLNKVVKNSTITFAQKAHF
jgi:hypothetical protein